MENQRFCGFRTLREQQLVTKQVYIDPINWCPAQLLIFMKKPITIYLADLVYDTVRTNHVVPLNVAYIAAYAKEYFADKVHIEIFKYPTELEKKLNEAPPDILGLSNYSWNERLNIVFLELAKKQNSNVITVMGGPNIRTHPQGIEDYLRARPHLDFYILFEGEEIFSELLQNLMEGNNKIPDGCASIVNNSLHYVPVDTRKKSKELNVPSPYLSGMLDPFLKDNGQIPLFETNRGCPFGCTYCAWGVAALSKVKKRPLDVIYKEMEYVATHSTKQVNWIFCDANFGILKRDVDIAKKIRSIMDRDGFPVSITLWASKNTSDRNIEISKIVKDSDGLIAIQSADLNVLELSGRGTIKFSHLRKQIDYYRENNLSITTDILIGLPGETRESHANTLSTAFDLGFEKISPYNIRMLPGTDYESEQQRDMYSIVTKFRPIYGSYGIYDNKKVFELEESVRATSSMTEPELESFKITHWLIYFLWNSGLLRPLLSYAQEKGVNALSVLQAIQSSDNANLESLFNEMKKESSAEWFTSQDEMINYYQDDKNFNSMVDGFAKLNFLWIAKVFYDSEIIKDIKKTTVDYLRSTLEGQPGHIQEELDDMAMLNDALICDDLLTREFSTRKKTKSKLLKYIGMNATDSPGNEEVEIEIYRDHNAFEYCQYHLCPDGTKDLSLSNLIRFFENKGLSYVQNSYRLL